jgi:superfamily I DNA/RNA helicase
MGKFTPSKQQKDIFKFILDGEKNAVISAVAGSGKTTTLLEALKLIPEDKTILFMAFNKSIAKELRERVPQRKSIKVMTVHGFGIETIRKSIKEPSIDNSKYRKILKDIIQFYKGKNDDVLDVYKFNKECYRFIESMANTVKNGDIDIDKFVKNVVDLSNLGRLHLIDFDTKPIGVNDLNKLADIHSINNEDGESTVAWYLSKLGLHYQDVVDFTDMIMFPNIMNLSTDVYDYVFIDECQDLNTCQRLLMEKAIKPDTGRFIAVGDPKQAIYAFAGADYESYQKLKNIPNTIELPLSVTYRCAEPIVKWVKHLNPLIKHFSKNKTGVVHETFSYKDIQDGDMVLCRNTFPIVALCIKLLSEGKKSYIIGSDIGMSLILMIENCEKKTEDFTMINVFSRLYHDKDKLIEKVMSNHKMIKSEAMEDSQVIIMNEKIQAIEVLSEGISNPHDVIKKIKELFSNDKKSGICLSNMHKSKGLESERVFIIHQELIPSKYAKLQWQIEQERNLEYVAYTRAKTTLGFVNDFDAFKSYKSQSENVVKVNESKHIGSPKMKMKFELKVVEKRNFKGPYGDTIIYEMVDKNGNLFSKFGEISEDYLLGTDDKVEVNSRVSFYGIIKSHSEFKGSKITNLGKITQY